jgi:GAF domain-containing protein
MDRLFVEELRNCSEEAQALRHLMRYAAGVMGTAKATTQLIAADFSHLEIVGQLGFDATFESYFKRVEHDSGTVCGRAVVERTPIIVEDALADAAALGHRRVFEEAEVRGVMSIPVITRTGAFYGIVSTHQPRPHVPTDQQIREVVAAAHKTADAIVSIRARRRIVRRHRSGTSV